MNHSASEETIDAECQRNNRPHPRAKAVHVSIRLKGIRDEDDPPHGDERPEPWVRQNPCTRTPRQEERHGGQHHGGELHARPSGRRSVHHPQRRHHERAHKNPAELAQTRGMLRRGTGHVGPPLAVKVMAPSRARPRCPR